MNTFPDDEYWLEDEELWDPDDYLGSTFPLGSSGHPTHDEFPLWETILGED